MHYLYVHCTYTFMNVNICMDMVQTRMYRFTTTLHFPSRPISLATPASLSSAQAPRRCLPHVWEYNVYLCIPDNLYIHVCRLYVHCTYLSVHGTVMFYSTEPASKMLLYMNWPFCTYSVQTRIYTPKTALAGGKLSCGISEKQCLSAAVQRLSMAERCSAMSVPYNRKCHRKAYHLPEPFKGCIYVSEHCMYLMANSCTIALWEAGSVQ